MNHLEKLKVLIPLTIAALLLIYFGDEYQITSLKVVGFIAIWFSALGWMIRYQESKKPKR